MASLLGLERKTYYNDLLWWAHYAPPPKRRNNLRLPLFILAGLFMLLLSSCGHKGPLYLPETQASGKSS